MIYILLSGLSGLCSTLMLVSLMLMHEGGREFIELLLQ